MTFDSSDSPNVPPSPDSEPPIKAELAEKSSAPGGRSFFSWAGVGLALVALWIVIAIGGIVVLRLLADDMDFAIINVITLILGFLVGVTILVWFVASSPFPGTVRYGTLGMVLLVIILLFAILKIDGTSGELVPNFRFRWSPPRDATLSKPVVEASPPGEELLEAASDADFAQFLGPERNAWVPGPRLVRDWQQQPPRELWRRSMGAGWCAFSVVHGFAITMEQRGEEELVTCYKVDTGEVCWVSAIQARHATVFGGVGPRSTPTIDQGRVYALGATGILRCLDGSNGQEIWSLDILRHYGSTPELEGRVLAWGRSNSPLIVDNLVVVPGGGPPGGPYKSLLALDKETGEVVWEAGDDQISYSSPVLGTLAGVRQIVSVNEDNITGHDPQGGRVLWEEPWPGNSAANASVAQPHILPGDQVMITKGYGEGAALIAIENEDGQFKSSKKWWEKQLLRTKFTQVCIRDGYAYGLSDGITECVDINTGKRMWKQGRHGQGQILGVDDVILVLSERGDLVLVDMSPKQYVELARLDGALDGQTWNNLCLYGNKLLIRNGVEAACYELPKRDSGSGHSGRDDSGRDDSGEANAAGETAGANSSAPGAAGTGAAGNGAAGTGAAGTGAAGTGAAGTGAAERPEGQVPPDGS
jgi:outer membrane protein assembly factor BamB